MVFLNSLLDTLATPEACRLENTGPANRRKPNGRGRLAPAFSPFPRRFRYLYRLGEGGQGIVHLCGDRWAPGSFVAVKVARSDAAARASLEREARALLALKGTWAVPEVRALVYRRGQFHGFVMRYLSGETLDRVLGPGRLPASRAVALAVAVGDAVLEVLQRDFIHRDLKPNNLLLSTGGRVQILDFGLACRPWEVPVNGELSGTMAYASPEQIAARPLNERSDLFSLGLVLYEIAAGRMFFSCDTDSFGAFMAGRACRLREPLCLEGVEPRLASLIRRLLTADPRRRASVAEVKARLRGLRMQRPLAASAAG
jgi:serine/threonine protein kinase